MLKGGLVLELRLDRARTTKDVDLRMVGSPEDVLAKLQEAGRKNLGDFMAFEIGPDDDHPELQNDGITGSRSASMWRSAIRSSASPRSWSRRTCSRLPASPRRR
ncbi:MAG: nucleotidyl transferase AbiEii/AbiGii toxin family protein [Myxococcota bacterium]